MERIACRCARITSRKEGTNAFAPSLKFFVKLSQYFLLSLNFSVQLDDSKGGIDNQTSPTNTGIAV